MKKTLITNLTFGALLLLSSFAHAATISATDGSCFITDVTVTVGSDSIKAASCAGAYTIPEGEKENASLINGIFGATSDDEAGNWSLAGKTESFDLNDDGTSGTWTYAIGEDQDLSSPFVIVLKASTMFSAYLFKNIDDLEDSAIGTFLISFQKVTGDGGSITPALSHLSIYTTDTIPGGGIFGSPVPLPAALWLFGPALLGFMGFRRKTKS